MTLLQLKGSNNDELGLYTTERKLTTEEIQEIFDGCFEQAFVDTDVEDDIHSVVDGQLADHHEIFRVFSEDITTDRL